MIGLLDVPGLIFPLWTLEDVPNGNLPGISCIPEGTYHCIPHGWRLEPVKFKKVWELTKVPNRSAILIHSGNTEADTHGCILIGSGVIRGRLLESKTALLSLQELIGPNEFDLTITSVKS